MKAWIAGLAPGAAALAVVACMEPVGSGAGLTESGKWKAAETTAVIDTAIDTTDSRDSGALPAGYFTGQVLPIFKEHCEQCHAPGGQGYGITKLSLEADSAFAGLVDRPSTVLKPPRPEMLRVKPGHSDSSFLYLKISGDEIRLPMGMGMRMPLQKPKLPDEQIEIIRKWIEAGAPQG